MLFFVGRAVRPPARQTRGPNRYALASCLSCDPTTSAHCASMLRSRSSPYFHVRSLVACDSPSRTPGAPSPRCYFLVAIRAPIAPCDYHFPWRLSYLGVPARPVRSFAAMLLILPSHGTGKFAAPDPCDGCSGRGRGLSSTLLLHCTHRPHWRFELRFRSLSCQRVRTVSGNLATHLVIVGEPIGWHAVAHCAPRLGTVLTITESTVRGELHNVLEDIAKRGLVDVESQAPQARCVGPDCRRSAPGQLFERILSSRYCSGSTCPRLKILTAPRPFLIGWAVGRDAPPTT